MYDASSFELDDEQDLGPGRFWLQFPYTLPPLKPIGLIDWVDQQRHGAQRAIDALALPNTAPLELRLRDGVGWVTHGEPPERSQFLEQRFRTRIRPYITDFEAMYQDATSEMNARYASLRSMALDDLTNFELVAHFEEAWATRRRMWELHYMLLFPAFRCFEVFEAVCRRHLGIDDATPGFHDLVRGLGNTKYEGDRGLWSLASRARELGLAELFADRDASELLAVLRADHRAPDWLDELGEYLDKYGWQGDRPLELSRPSWVDDPTPALAHIQRFVLLGGNFELDAKEPAMRERRDRATEIVMRYVSEPHRAWFKLLLRAAQHASTFSEEHNYVFDNVSRAVLHRALNACGGRLAEHGAITAAEDVFFLAPDEIRKVLGLPGRFDLRGTVARRRVAWEAALEQEFPQVIGDISPEEAMAVVQERGDPATRKVVVGRRSEDDSAAGTQLDGTSGAPGIAEGPARVVRSSAELSTIHSGDVLVAPTTHISWAPAFSYIAGVIVDRGASLSHAAIVSREYGIPCVINTYIATSAIKTGQRVRVDGDRGVVVILP